MEAYAHNVGDYLGFLDIHRGEALAIAALGDVSAAELRAYLASRRKGESALAPRSLSQLISAIRGFHKWLDLQIGRRQPAVALVQQGRVSRLRCRGR